MPVTAKLSREFYERLGDDLADELVNWFNAVDATYRSELRDLNELNFQRFDAKVEQRFAQAEARVDRRFAEYDAKWEERIGRLEVSFERRLGETHVGLIRWMFGFWIATLVPLGGLMIALFTVLS
jgi:hypothetical protein